MIHNKFESRCKKVFAPEHGYRGISDAGEYVNDGIDIKTGLPIVSLYGKNRKPNTNSLKDLDLIIFDIRESELDFTLLFQHYIT